MLLLDTHVWHWLVEGLPRLAEPQREIIEERARDEGVLVSIISVWEICQLEARKRVIFDIACANWLADALAEPIQVSPLTPTIALESTRLPGTFHRDPADRLITATARLQGLTLVTRDRRILDYADAGHVSVLAC